MERLDLPKHNWRNWNSHHGHLQLGAQRTTAQLPQWLLTHQHNVKQSTWTETTCCVGARCLSTEHTIKTKTQQPCLQWLHERQYLSIHEGTKEANQWPVTLQNEETGTESELFIGSQQRGTHRHNSDSHRDVVCDGPNTTVTSTSANWRNHDSCL